MFRLPSFLRRPGRRKNTPDTGQALQTDEIEIEIAGVIMRVKRRLSLDIPHEVTVIIPRVEIRRREYQNGQPAVEDEMILNSITIVHAPRHPPAGETPPGVGPKPEENSGQNAPRLKLNYK